MRKVKKEKLTWLIKKHIEDYGKQQATLVIRYDLKVKKILKNLNNISDLEKILKRYSINFFTEHNKNIYIIEVMESLAHCNFYNVNKEWVKKVITENYYYAYESYLNKIMEYRE